MTNFEIEELLIAITSVEKQVADIKDTLKWHLKIFGRESKKQPTINVHMVDEFEKYFGKNAE